MTHNNRIQWATKTIRNVLAHQFVGVTILDVSLVEALDHDGDEILRVEIVFESANGRLDPMKVKGLIRHLRTALADQDEDRFPVMTYLTSKDLAERKSAAH